ncbi:glycosyltransferase [Dolichospermum circinale]|uniref:glycosyltransferase n=1 Tax=Dolichospermum circinale TaxID=109265 RepID=UPI00232B10EE|nr:glycosyltransferase family 2 protein [Dolichospermum circinale]MDB9454019.1 glycosyltransferase family 2 protein [Dolichospermum circinale CS-541/06]MDB9463194.1 glycosyltransferase family 2 protein [Dolichospermum circinale CS-541/04]MDB9548999.1 glycosyltransferase family 2 protein [Dolichospermum circinale CS-1031]
MNTNSSNSLLPVPCGALRISELTPDPKNENNIMLLSIVIPTYKERDNIENVVNILSGLLDKTIPGNYELIVVDDDSPDRTWEVAENLIPDYPQLRVMRRQEERGLSSAVIRGWQVARGSILGVIDGDLQHPPEVLTQLWQKIEQGADLAVASRHVEGGGVSSWSVIRRFLSRGAQVLGLVILPEVVGRVSDPMSGYFMVRRKAIANTTLNPIGYKILLEVIGRGQIGEIGEAGYIFRERTEGESKVTWKQYVDYIQHLIRLRLSTGRIGKISQKVNFPVGRFLRFGAVGLSGVFVDLTIFHLMRTVINLGLTRSTILSAEIAILNNFLWNDLWTFGDISRKQTGKRQRFKRFLKFNIVCLAGIIIQTLVVNFLYNNLGMNQYIAKLIAIAVATIWNFWVNLKLSWRVTEVK